MSVCIPSSPCTFHTQNRKLFPLWSPLEPCVPCLSKQRLCRCQCAHFKHRRSLYHPVTGTGIFFLLPTWGARNSHDYYIKSLSSLSSLFFLNSSAVVIDFFFKLGKALPSRTFAVDYPELTLDQLSETVCMTLRKQVRDNDCALGSSLELTAHVTTLYIPRWGETQGGTKIDVHSWKWYRAWLYPGLSNSQRLLFFSDMPDITTLKSRHKASACLPPTAHVYHSTEWMRFGFRNGSWHQFSRYPFDKCRC